MIGFGIVKYGKVSALEKCPTIFVQVCTLPSLFCLLFFCFIVVYFISSKLTNNTVVLNMLNSVYAAHECYDD